MGVGSKNFLQHAESFVSFQRLHELYFGESLEEKIRMISDIGERVAYVVEFMLQKTGLDVSNYLKKILTLDMLTLNTDRHFNNLGIVVNADLGIYRESPVFDTGNALLSDWSRFPAENTPEKIWNPFTDGPSHPAWNGRRMSLVIDSNWTIRH